VDQTTIITAVVCLVIGLVIGSLLTRVISPQSAKNRELRKKLQEKEDELKVYRQDVSDHFLRSAELVRELTRSQQEISEQLATAAMRLTAPEVSRQVHNTAFEGLATDSSLKILSAFPPEAPKDYAPSVPGGVLSESYGLTDLQDGSTTRGLDSAKSGVIQDDQEDDPTLKIS